MDRISCPSAECSRTFVDQATMHDHAEAVHTFDDVRQAVCEELREAFVGVDLDNDGDAIQWLYVVDIADDWVVFQAEDPDGDSDLYKVGYTMDATGNVTFTGAPVEVVRRTVYDAVPEDETDNDQQSGQQSGQYMLVPVS